jgi:pyruvyltransferase
VRPRYRGRLGRYVPLPKRPVSNFGDLLGPLIVDGMRRHLGFEGPPTRDAQLLSIGSVMHFAHDDAVVWGTGVNGKADASLHRAERLDVRATRGPVTEQWLRSRGFDVPSGVHGDPALLLPWVLPELQSMPNRRDVTVVMNLNDPPPRGRRDALDPRRPLRECLETIAASRLVVGSSLHGVIVAEALGIPARLVASTVEPRMKYDDYYGGTGRPEYHPARSIDEAIAIGGEEALSWDPDPLIAAFPTDLWHASGPDAG